MSRATRVVMIGGGAAGTLTAIHLLRRAPARVRVTVVEPRETMGQGVAFGTPDAWHRLNVPAITMTGVPDDPDGFRAFAGVAPDAFPPRRVFGEYLAALLRDARASSPATFDHVQGRAARIRDGEGTEDGALVVELVDGRRIAADAVVIA